uniref:Hypothetical UPF0187 protein n=1 Tax=Escherichia coli TaxID=562 RepID=A1YN36_ECOLX|nr:hypothetical UPF0187 protein [Escherichia coli]
MIVITFNRATFPRLKITMIVRPQQHWLRRIFVWHGSVLSKISSRLSVADVYFHELAVWQSTARFSNHRRRRVDARYPGSRPTLMQQGGAVTWATAKIGNIIDILQRHSGKQLHRRTRSFSGKVRI